MADGEDDDILYQTSQGTRPDQWLKDEPHASGKWKRFAIEGVVLPMAESTRLQTPHLEFAARGSWTVYVPMMVWEPKWVNTNPDANDPKAIWPVFKADGTPILLRDGSPVFQQGFDMVPLFLAGILRAAGVRTRNRFSLVPFIGGKDWPKRYKKSRKRLEKDIKALFSKKGDGKIPEYIKEEFLQEVRYWVPTPVPDGSWNQAPRFPFDMIPKLDLDEAYDADVLIKESVFQEAIKRMATLDSTDYRELPNEFVDYQYCGVPGLDEEFIRAYRCRTEPRLAKIPQQFRELYNLGIVLWKQDSDSKKLEVARWLENPAGITMRVHRELHNNFITGQQVFDGLDRMKADPRTGYNPDPENLVSEMVVLGWTFSEVEEAVKKRLVEIAQTDFLEAGRLRAKIRKSFEDWIMKWYDRTLPNEQYRYHEWFSDLEQLHVNDWKSRADRWWYQMQLRVCLRKAPGLSSSTSQRANFLEMELLVADFESWRNLEHMQEHWKYSKAFGNTVGSMDDDKTAPRSMRQRDWGGIWNPLRAELDWRFAKLDALAPIPEGRPMTPEERELRMELLGPAWFDKRPWQIMDHDGSLIDRFGQKKVSWVGAMRNFKGLSSKAGTATFPKRVERGLDAELAENRDYPSEYQMLRYDEYFARDPVDVIENQKGIVVFSVLDDVNARLHGRFARYPGLRLNYDNCTSVASFIVKMWKTLPAEPIVKAIEGSMRGWKRKNIPHFRPEIDKMLDGVHINAELRPYVEKWYRLSDERVWDFVYWKTGAMSTVEFGPSGANGFMIKEASDLCGEGFGLNYDSLAMQQTRQEALLNAGLWTGYMTVVKGVVEWWSIRRTAFRTMEAFKKSPDYDELKMHLAGMLESRKLIWSVARDIIWPLLKINNIIASETPFPWHDPRADDTDWAYIREVLNTTAGTKYIPSQAASARSTTLRELRDERIGANEERFTRIREKRFFEVNQ